MKELLMNPVTYVVAIIVIAVLFFLFKNRKKALKAGALYIVSVAEKAWGSKTGQIKFADCYNYLTKHYPFVTLFLTEKMLTKIIEDALECMKNVLKDKTPSDTTKAIEDLIKEEDKE